MGYIPIHHVNLPVAAPQRATVVSNADPEGKGRVQVQMQFQKYANKETNWIRALSPDAGAGARGYIFVPEVGDEVMVQFEENDPARPYCAGSVFAEPTARGGLSDNHLKSIITRSGIKMVFNDNEGSLHIEDPSGNTWDMDGKGNIAVNAPKNMSIRVGDNLDVNVGKNISVTAGQNISAKAGDSIMVDAGKDISESAGNNISQSAMGDILESSDNRIEIVENDYTRNAQKSDHFANEINIASSKENITIQSAKTVEWNSGEKSNMF